MSLLTSRATREWRPSGATGGSEGRFPGHGERTASGGPGGAYPDTQSHSGVAAQGRRFTGHAELLAGAEFSSFLRTNSI